MKLKPTARLKTKLSPTLKSWFPVLQSSVADLEEVLGEFVLENPFVEINSSFCESLPQAAPVKSRFLKDSNKRYMSDKIEALSVYEKSLYEVLESQITPPLFPTALSQKIALMIIDEINDEGYFSGSEEEIARACNVELDIIRRTRERFAHMNPSGVGAKNALESMLFQLEDIEICDELYDLVFNLINHLQKHMSQIAPKSLGSFDDLDLLCSYDMENYAHFSQNPLFEEAIKIIKKFSIPPALEFAPKENFIIPDLIINEVEGALEVQLNDMFYPNILIDKHAQKSDNSDIKIKLKEARDLIDALSMRKSTIKKIGLMILEYQYDFFVGGKIKPMKLKDIADELGHNPSTISRAVANKYLECNRGIYPLKSFFTTAINEETSNTSIKDFIIECIKRENTAAPLSDIQILELIEKKFKLKMVRRTITKYRKQLDIPSSARRKRLYKIKFAR